MQERLRLAMYQDHLRWSEALMFWRKESLDNDRFQTERCDRQRLALDRCVTGRLEAAWRRTDRHRDELEQLKESVQALEGRVLVLGGKKIALELGMERLSERLCRCSGASTRAPGEGSPVGSYEMSDASEVAEHHEVESPMA